MDITRVAAVSPITRVTAFNRKEARTDDKRREEDTKRNDFANTLKQKINHSFDSKV
ncbi:hypothetical protein EHE19_011130 [Ruminiclostridium herbifermentans]|uniref:Uncharacterized protein n=1 Tax=Ruminiclostridium herbifermentans TaxID=2488810 RepID=A0A7H1VJB9_9FIRM|nr:hypothetical protein [Ruminiclostridium herbifermentans]QNU65481.1 hypothetical protein EHE19_011130 [Ruminiclostridium herbifermentans]